MNLYKLIHHDAHKSIIMAIPHTHNGKTKMEAIVIKNNSIYFIKMFHMEPYKSPLYPRLEISSQATPTGTIQTQGLGTIDFNKNKKVTQVAFTP
jgi:hypothetical protein